MTFRIVFCTAFFFNVALSIVAQQYTRNYDIPVLENDVALANPWAGGLNTCQLSRIDINMDGKKDLFIFDRIGSRISIFINMDNTPGAMNYKYTMEFNHLFPQGLRNWVLLRDMNCDGREDICTNTGSGFRIFWNISDVELEFDMNGTASIAAFYDWGSSSINSGVFSISPDIPALEDYDNDGDIDIWSWNESSSALFFYKNMAVENGDCSIPTYECRNRCYGMFGESVESFELFLGEDFTCDFNIADPRSDEPGPFRHTGGTTLAIDLDQNGLKDLVIGDVTENTLAALLMVESSNGQDSAMAADYNFPATFSNTEAAIMTTFLAAFYEDVNNDDVRDLLVSTNSFTDAEDRNSLILYINNGQNDLPEFERIQDDFLQAGMIDLGSNAFPVTTDVDQDGLMDIVVANRRFFEFGNAYTSRLYYYRNVGTPNAPSFQLTDDNWLDIPSQQWLSVYPAFGDLDGDDDADLMLGDLDGLLHFFTNLSGPGAPAVYSSASGPVTDSNGAVIDVGQNATPQIFDVDDDGRNDLLIGELNGCVNYYRNIGSASTYNFSLIEDTIGNAVATNLLGIQGKSVPCMYRNGEGLLEMLIGTETGQINHYNNIEDNILGNFNLVTNDYEGINEGERSSVHFADINSDGQPDLFVGNVAGGLGIYTHIPVGQKELTSKLSLKIYPNPGDDLLTLEIPEKLTLPAELLIYDASGKLAFNTEVSARKNQISTENFGNGIYQMILFAGETTMHQRIVISHR